MPGGRRMRKLGGGRNDAAASAAAHEALPSGRGSGIGVAYQPIVDLDRLSIVGYEALARDASGRFASTSDLFERARNDGAIVELDLACQSAALRGALAGGICSPLGLFVNIEPEAVAFDIVPGHLDLIRKATSRMEVVFEITERSLTLRPAELLATVQRLRALGALIAIDDVGADPRSLALMPLLRPDLIKLELRLVQQQPDRQAARIMTAIASERERTGAGVVAEGIETLEHLDLARALGATHAQGWLFGRPGPLPDPLPAGAGIANAGAAGRGAGATPFEVVSAVRPTRPAHRSLLLRVSEQLEEEAGTLGESAVVVSAFQQHLRFTRRTAHRYARLADRAALVAALGVGMPEEPARGVRGARIGSTDALSGEWSVVVVAPHYAAALVAAEQRDERPSDLFDYALTTDRALVLDAAATLVARIAAA